MHPDVIQKLFDLNQEFYQSFAEAFSETRERVQPGVLQAILGILAEASVLDLGCGNGSLSIALADGGHQGQYLGVDSSQALLEIASKSTTHTDATFVHQDIATGHLSDGIEGKFDRIFAFALLHHIPSSKLRKRMLKEVRRLIEPEGVFTFSIWNFLESPKLRGRVLPWSTVELLEEQLEGGDYLLDWKRGGYGLRYVHAFEDDELVNLARVSGFEQVETYFSDGEGGKLGWYQVWKPQE